MDGFPNKLKKTVQQLQRREGKVRRGSAEMSHGHAPHPASAALPLCVQAILICAATCVAGAIGFVACQLDPMVVKAEGEKKDEPKVRSFVSSGQQGNLRRTLSDAETKEHEDMEDKIWEVMFWSAFE